MRGRKKCIRKYALWVEKRGPIMVANHKTFDATIISRLCNEIALKPRRKILKIDWDPVSQVPKKCRKKCIRKYALWVEKRGPIMVANHKTFDATIISRLCNEIGLKPRRKILKIDWDPVSQVPKKAFEVFVCVCVCVRLFGASEKSMDLSQFLLFSHADFTIH